MVLDRQHDIERGRAADAAPERIDAPLEAFVLGVAGQDGSSPRAFIKASRSGMVFHRPELMRSTPAPSEAAISRHFRV